MAEGAEGSDAGPAPSKPAPTKVAYHPDVRCQRGGGGKGPVIVGPMYRVGEGYVCEEKATDEEKANGPVEPANDEWGVPVEGFDEAIAEYVGSLSSLSRPVLRLTKRTVVEGMAESLWDAFDRAEKRYLHELMELS